jgi:rubrerythrin
MPIDQSDVDAIEPTRASPLASMTCGTCGYGVRARTPPARCPMCGASAWEYDRWRPFAGDLKPRQRASR